MITITYDTLMETLGLFTALCIAGGWLIKIIKGVKEPAVSANEKIHNNSEKLNELEEQFDYINKAVAILMKSNLAMLGHMVTDNNTGGLKRAEQEIQEFLIKKC